jgi:hypothetical protein
MSAHFAGGSPRIMAAMREAELTGVRTGQRVMDVGLGQETRVSAIENGSIAELSTLGDYIRALGGELKVIDVDRARGVCAAGGECPVPGPPCRHSRFGAAMPAAVMTSFERLRGVPSRQAPAFGQLRLELACMRRSVGNTSASDVENGATGSTVGGVGEVRHPMGAHAPG